VAASAAVHPGSPAADALAVVQARMSSTRLPGKVLADVGGEPMLVLLLRRLERAPSLRRIVVATSDHPSDDPVADVARAAGAGVHRGPLEDVLSRYVGAARGHDGPIVRVTADAAGAVLGPAMGGVLTQLFDWRAIFAAQAPIGALALVAARGAAAAEPLRLADRLADDAADREHVTTIMRRRPDDFSSASLTGPHDLAHLRWTVDDQDDLEFVRAVVSRLGPARYTATMHDILEAVRRPPPIGGPGGLRG
jgi:spore coat polysaccharide biosynthesis protein SpsF (cytidylyltransferase family)